MTIAARFSVPSVIYSLLLTHSPLSLLCLIGLGFHSSCILHLFRFSRAFITILHLSSYLIASIFFVVSYCCPICYHLISLISWLGSVKCRCYDHLMIFSYMLYTLSFMLTHSNAMILVCDQCSKILCERYNLLTKKVQWMQRYIQIQNQDATADKMEDKIIITMVLHDCDG